MARRSQELNVRIRSRIQKLMRAHGLSQAALARATGERPQDINRFLTDDMAYPPLDFLDRLARVFHYTLADLLAKDLPPARLTPDEVTLLARYRATTSARDRHAALSFLHPPPVKRRRRANSAQARAARARRARR